MLRFSLRLTPVLVLILTAQSFGQCGSSRRHGVRSAPAVRTQPAATVVRDVQPQPAPVAEPVATERVSTSSPALPVTPERDEFAEIAARKPAEIRSATNGSRLRIAIDTQKKPKGMAILSVGGVSLLIEPEQWKADSVLVKLPPVLLREPQAARLFIAATPDDLLQRIDFQITP